MQSVDTAYSDEELESTRLVVQNTQVAWHKQFVSGNQIFTVGTSTIGGNDVIGINPGAIGSPGNYKYFDESNYVMSATWERGLSQPIGGLNKGLADMVLDNTSDRFTPRAMGGHSELFTAILPRRPLIINAGFNYAGIDNTIPQFSGVLNKTPSVDVGSRQVALQAADYVDFFQNKVLDKTIMFTSEATDQVLATILSDAGLSAGQYVLDHGINIIPFGLFNVGDKLSDIIDQLVQAENGQFYQDEQGIFRFENRQHWDVPPYTQVQKVILTSQVIAAGTPSDDNIINVIEISSHVRSKQPLQIIFTLSSPLIIQPSSDQALFVNFTDPVLSMNTPTGWVANTISDGSGTDISTSVTLSSQDVFAQSAKLTFHNATAGVAYMTSLSLYGRPAKITSDLYFRAQDDSSVTAYEERIFQINNDYIQDSDWASIYSQIILGDYSDPYSIQKITIRSMPELQLGDLISWQGRYWRLVNIKTTFDPNSGFLQELTLIQRKVSPYSNVIPDGATAYFRIGISLIGGTDQIS